MSRDDDCDLSPREIASPRDADDEGDDVRVVCIDEGDDATPRARASADAPDATTSTRAFPDASTAPDARAARFKPELSVKSYFKKIKPNDATRDGDATTPEDASPKRRRGLVKIEFEKDRREFTTKAIGGCKVKFPEGLNPHPAQTMTMSSIIRALTKREHAMIESPTGTGKTLALLCGALAWQEREVALSMEKNKGYWSEKMKYQTARNAYVDAVANGKTPTVERGVGWASNDPYFPNPHGSTLRPKIFICSRTHSQINQILRELKRTGYSPRYSVLSSRQRMCPMEKNDAQCKELLGTGVAQQSGRTACGFFNRHKHVSSNMERYPKAGEEGMFPSAWDMEDFERVVNEIEGCSFYALREMVKTADLIFCPYNYLFDVNIRRKMKIDLKDAAVLIDEGHNLEDVCREGSSIEFSLDTIRKGKDELSKTWGKINNETSLIARFFRAISEFMEGLFCTNPAPTTVIQSNQLEYFVNDMLKTFNAVGEYTQDIIDVVEKLLTEGSNLMSPIIAPHITFAGDLAEVLQNAVKHAAAYNIFIGSRVEIDGDECPGMVIQCMKPSVAFHAVAEKARSVIITSGTLSPMNTFEAELAEKFPTKIEAPHVVPNDHVYVEVTSAIGEVTYKATDGHVQGPKFAKKLGEYLLKYAQVIPGGMLVFLPKYSLIDRVLREWHVTGLFGKMNDYKRVVVETRGARGFQDTLNEFNLGNTNGKGSLMLAVYRGKVSEGIDFKDDSARAVFCVGIPFPSVYDIKVKAKKEFNDLPVSRAQGMLSGGEWYRAQAYRAYNQALGRCIRHPKDYAALFLVDSRFRESRWMLNNISKWIRNNAQASDDVNQSVRVVDGFFKRLRGASDGNAPAGSTAKHEETQQKENLLCGLGCEKNAALCAALERLHEASMLSPEEPMKVNAYAKALTSIRALKYEVTSGAKMSKAGPDKVQHVGPSMGAQIDFFLKHGVFERMEYYERKELPPSSAK